MLHLRAYLFLFYVIGIVHFAICDVNCDEEVAPGSEEPSLSHIENVLGALNDVKNKAQDSIMGTIERGKDAIMGKLGFGKDKPEVKEKLSLGQVLNRFAPQIRLIYPGTLWCGDGDIAKQEKDLGLFQRTDACCREHDHCLSSIEAGETLVNLKNNGIFTKSACHCDTQFYDCLKAVNGIVSTKIGTTYFNILQPQCFKCACPNDSCPEHDDMDCIDQCRRFEWSSSPRFVELLG